MCPEQWLLDSTACKPRQTASAQKDWEKKLEGRHWHTELVLQRSNRTWPPAAGKSPHAEFNTAQREARSPLPAPCDRHRTSPPHQAAVSPPDYSVCAACRPSPQLTLTLRNNNHKNTHYCHDNVLTYSCFELTSFLLLKNDYIHNLREPGLRPRDFRSWDGPHYLWRICPHYAFLMENENSLF